MPGVIDSPATPVALSPFSDQETLFELVKQKVWLDINPLSSSRSIAGRTEITVVPATQDARILKLNCRQARITKLSSSLGRAPNLVYKNAYQQASLPGQTTANQWHIFHDRIEEQLKPTPQPELQVNFGKTKYPEAKVQDTDGDIIQISEITVFVEFQIDRVRDGLQFVGCDAEDLRYPHCFTQAYPGSAACCLFPCVDNDTARQEWEIAIKTPKTIGDALASSGRQPDVGRRFSEEDKARDLTVVCSGELTDEIADKQDSSKKETSFRVETPVLARHVGFAIGPFEQVNLSAFRESGEDEKLGKSAVQILGFCLPGRSGEVANTCFPLAKALDHFAQIFQTYPFKSYSVAFVDDMIEQGRQYESLGLCSTRLLFPEDILEPLNRVTRYLAFCVASQWFGVNIIPANPKDTWTTVGLAYYMADIFMRLLTGNNEYRYFQKRQADLVYESDVKRPSLLQIGENLWFDPAQIDFLSLKASTVMFILNQRLVKAHGTTGLNRIIFKICLSNSAGDLANGALETERFMRNCEKTGHVKLETFFSQWVEGAGCPRFQVTQRFNKKRLVVELHLKQVQLEALDDETIQPENFVRDVREEIHDVYAGAVQHCFRGPMTIRIHEADGTPYEHIVEIKDMITRIDIPYNTKYKRLKRTRRYKEKLAQGGNADDDAQAGLYMLGDNLATEEEIADWNMTEFSKEDEDRMNSESFEWIRLDADFEWIARVHFNMPPHMYLSQLQQDRDVVAQLESITYFANSKENTLVSSWLVRTLMDRRYFYGIRSAAATALSKHAKDEVGWIGFFHLKKAFQTLFCMPNGMIRPNDFFDRALHHIQCSVVRSMGRIRDNAGRAPYDVRRFLYESLRYNDNSTNEFSDAHFLQAVMRALGSAVASAPPLETDIMETDLENADDIAFFRSCLEEIDRHRRLDEWMPSYHNVLSIEGLNAKADLMRAGQVSKDPRELLRYTQRESHEDLRIAAFEHLLILGLGRESRIMAWYLLNLGHEMSAYVRKQLMDIFGRWLGMVATGQLKQAEPMNDSATDGLILETEAADSGKVDEDRQKTISGALAALKTELASDESFQSAIWTAVQSPELSFFELGALLDVCAHLYETKNSLRVVFRLPRYWRVASEGLTTRPDGKQSLIMKFKQTDRVRQKPIQKWQPFVNDTISVAGPTKISFKRKSSSMAQDSLPAPKAKVQKRNATPNGHAMYPPPVSEGKKSLKLKLKMPGAGAGMMAPGAQTPGASTPGAQTPGGSQKRKLTLKPPTPGGG